MIRALFPATFDPFTNGHYDIACRAASLFDEVVIAVFATPQKNVLFSVDERVAMIRDSMAGVPNVRVASYHGLTVDYARKIGARVMVRGLRVVSDFEWEFQLALMNHQLAPELDTVCLLARGDFSFLSSSIVKEVAQHGGDVRGLVPEVVAAALANRFAPTRGAE